MDTTQRSCLDLLSRRCLIFEAKPSTEQSRTYHLSTCPCLHLHTSRITTRHTKVGLCGLCVCTLLVICVQVRQISPPSEACTTADPAELHRIQSKPHLQSIHCSISFESLIIADRKSRGTRVISAYMYRRDVQDYLSRQSRKEYSL